MSVRNSALSILSPLKVILSQLIPDLESEKSFFFSPAFSADTEKLKMARVKNWWQQDMNQNPRLPYRDATEQTIEPSLKPKKQVLKDALGFRD